MRDMNQTVFDFLDGELDEAGQQALAQWLSESAENRRRFALLTSEQYLIRKTLRRQAMSDAPRVSASTLRELLVLEQQANAEMVPWAEESEKPNEPPRPRVAPTKETGPRIIVVPRWMVFLGAAAAVALAFFVLPARPSREVDQPVAQRVRDAPATIESSQNAILAPGSGFNLVHGQRLPAGEIELRSGTLTLRFDGGAQVVLSGPCVFAASSAHGMRLDAGRMVAHCPPEAVGFAVDTAQERIIDRGTTFGLIADTQASQLQVHVFRGAVDLYRRSKGQDDSYLIAQMSELDACAVDKDGVASTVEISSSAFHDFAPPQLLPRVLHATLTFRQGYDGYTSARDTWFSPRTSPEEYLGHPDGTYIRVGGWSDIYQQGLICFDRMIGAGAHQLPAGARVISAKLVLHNARDIQDTFGATSPEGEPFAVYPMLVGWTDRSTIGDPAWRGGASDVIDTDGMEAASDSVADCRGQVGAGGLIPAGTRIELDVTDAVQDWADGAPNHGFLLQSFRDVSSSEDHPSESNAIFVASSEYMTDPALRPALTVTYLTIE